jgi:hypothetical protein
MRFNPNTSGPQVPGREPITYQQWLAQQAEKVVVNTPEIDALIQECLDRGLDPTPELVNAGPTAAQLVADHTGNDVYLFADKIADELLRVGVRLTSGERLLIVRVIEDHRAGR